MHIYFDLDGTLLKTGDTVLMAVRAMYEELGIEGAEDERILESIGRPMDEFLRNILPDNIQPEEVRDSFRRHEQQATREHGTLFPGIRDMLSALSGDGHELYICSNGRIEYIELVLESTGIRAYFSGLFSAAKHESKAHFLSEVLRPGDQAVFIGDSWDDIGAGLKNNIPAIAALYGYGRKDLLADVTFTVSNPCEITGWVRQIEVFSQITSRLIKNGRRVIGISGVDTSGKTSFTDNFARYLRSAGYRCAVIHLDDFHNPLAVRRQGSNEIDAYYTNAFNYEQLMEELLVPLREGGRLDKEIQCLNVDTDRYENIRRFTADRDTVVLLEGVLLFRPPVMDYLDGRVWLDVGFDEVLKRARTRDVPKYGAAFLQKYIDKYIPVQKRYMDDFAPHLHCDVFVDNTDYLCPQAR